MRIVLVVTVVLLITACGNFRQPTEPWPAKLAGFEGFTAEEQKEIIDSIHDINERAGHTLISPDSPSGNFLISFELMETAPNNPTRVGLAVAEESKCTIKISKTALDLERKLWESVVAHELGHCAGFGHDPQAGEIMYSIALPFPSYSSQSIERFLKRLLVATGVT